MNLDIFRRGFKYVFGTKGLCVPICPNVFAVVLRKSQYIDIFFSIFSVYMPTHPSLRACRTGY